MKPPCASWNTAMRPAVITSIGGTTTVPPAAVTFSATSSASVTLMYDVHAGGPGFTCGPYPATTLASWVKKP
jgi:hypothetical protein